MIHALYNRIRPHLPRREARYSDVPVRDAGLLDIRTEFPCHKDVLVDAVQATVRPGDNVTVIGGGRGIVAVVAAREVGVAGDVTVIEAAEEQCDRTRETVAYNGLGNVSIRHAIVGSVVDVWGETAGADILTPDDLHDDVWIVDIEGGERGLVSQLSPENKPETCIIETHPDVGVSVSALRTRLMDCYPFARVIPRTEHTTAMQGPVLLCDRR